MKAKREALMVLSTLLLIVFLLGGTYAWLKVSVTSESNQVIHAGKLDLVLDDE